MERENNLKEYKSAYDIDTMPKYGAGSEYGRDQKEEARRKKHGINIKKYNPEDQPWLMKVGSGKTARRYARALLVIKPVYCVPHNGITFFKFLNHLKSVDLD